MPPFASAYPSPPSNLHVINEQVAGDGTYSVAVAWDMHWDENVIGYYIHYLEGYGVQPYLPYYDNYAAKNGRGNTSHTFTGLTAGVVYTFVVTAVDLGYYGNYEESVGSNIAALKTGPPAQPTGFLTDDAKNGTVSLSWHANTVSLR